MRCPLWAAFARHFAWFECGAKAFGTKFGLVFTTRGMRPATKATKHRKKIRIFFFSPKVKFS
jgi:hypothetical protein